MGRGWLWGTALASLSLAAFWPEVRLVAVFFAGLMAGVASWMRDGDRADALAVHIDELDELMCLVSARGSLLGLSRALEARVGPTSERDLVALFPAEHRAQASRAFERALEGGTALFTAELVAAGGRTWVDCSLSLCRHCAGRAVLCVIRDVEDRVVLERTLAIDQTFLERVVDATSLAILVYRTDNGECVLSNAAAVRMFETTLGTTAWHLREADFFRTTGWLEPCEETVRTGVSSAAEVATTSSTGERVWLSGSFIPFTALETSYLLVGLEDISRARQVEEQLRAAKEAAEAGTRAKGVFLANMSHEIRTPLNGVLGSAELLLDTPLEAAQLELAQTLHRSAGGLLTILNDILDFSKIDSGALAIEEAPFSLEDVVFDVVELFRAQLAGRSLDFIARVAPSLPPQHVGDAGRLRRCSPTSSATPPSSPTRERCASTPSPWSSRAAPW